MSTEEKSSHEKMIEYHYNAYKNLIKIVIFLDAAGITAVMATFGLKYKSTEKMTGAGFMGFKDPFDLALNSSLDYFLISLVMVVICAITEYLSYWPRRKHKHHTENSLNCCLCECTIKVCETIIFLSLSLSCFFLILGGIGFRNVSFL